jgi:hypothetical protein
LAKITEVAVTGGKGKRRKQVETASAASALSARLVVEPVDGLMVTYLVFLGYGFIVNSDRVDHEVLTQRPAWGYQFLLDVMDVHINLVRRSDSLTWIHPQKNP